MKRKEGFSDAKLRFLDGICNNGKVTRRTHVSIERSRETKRAGALYTEVVLSKGSVFESAIIVKKMTEDEEKLLVAAVRSAGDYGFGGGRSRGLGFVSVNISEIDEKELLILYKEGDE